MDKFENIAKELDAQDPLKELRNRFVLPKDPNHIYLCNNSLGLPAAATPFKMQTFLQDWAELGVEGWFDNSSNWYQFSKKFLQEPLAHLLGASKEEVIVMNSLTVNLHLLLTSFYQPTQARFKILMEGPTFPSDLYAIKSHITRHGLNAEEALLLLEFKNGEQLLNEEDIKQVLHQQGDSIALVYLNNVNFLTGQVLDVKPIIQLAKSKGCLVGLDIAHAAGNIPLKLHEWNVDFAVGCSYKYLCSGPGGPGIAYVHASHHNRELPRLSGWWGNDPSTRFQMQLQPEFVPYGGAASWQISTPSILSMVPLAASLEVFKDVGIETFRKKSEKQTAFLLELLETDSSGSFEILTPKDPKQRGCQISLIVHKNSEEVLQKLKTQGIICDYRPPNVIRVTPSPFYTTYLNIYQFYCRFSKINAKNKSERGISYGVDSLDKRNRNLIIC